MSGAIGSATIILHWRIGISDHDSDVPRGRVAGSKIPCETL
jgi:hypothetical protein